MKATTLAGVASGILLTASAVVAFVQQAPTTLTSNRGMRSYSIQIAASSNSNTDLSSLLESAKSDFGGAGSNAKATVTSKIGDAATSAATKVPDIPTISEPVKKILKATQETVATTQDGKSPTLGDFIIRGVPEKAATHDTSVWDTAMANFGRLGSNIAKMTGNEQYVQDLPDATKTWIALGTGTALVILAANKNRNASPNGKNTAASNETIQAASDAIGGLTDELVSMIFSATIMFFIDSLLLCVYIYTFEIDRGVVNTHSCYFLMFYCYREHCKAE